MWNIILIISVYEYFWICLYNFSGNQIVVW